MTYESWYAIKPNELMKFSEKSINLEDIQV